MKLRLTEFLVTAQISKKLQYRWMLLNFNLCHGQTYVYVPDMDASEYLLRKLDPGLLDHICMFSIALEDEGTSVFCKNIAFWRSKATAALHPAMAYAADCNSTGGSPYVPQRSICCTADLTKLEGCIQGKLIRTPSASNANCPVV